MRRTAFGSEHRTIFWAIPILAKSSVPLRRDRFNLGYVCIFNLPMAKSALLLLTLASAATTSVDSKPEFHSTGPGPYQIAMGDLNRDNRPDLVIPCRGELLSPNLARPANDTITVYLGTDNGSLGERHEFPVGFGPYSATVTDLDSDGRADVVIANFQSNDGRDLAFLWGSEDRHKLLEGPSFLKVQGRAFSYDKDVYVDGKPVYPAPGLTSVAWGDFNCDGKPDLVATAWSSDFLLVLLNLGGRKFRQVRIPLLPGPRDVVVSDFDGDGHDDVAITLYSSNLVEVLRGNGRGGFSAWRRFHCHGNTPYHLKAGDLDGDGRTDLVVGNRGISDNIAVFQNAREGFRFVGSFTPGTSKKGEATADEIRDVLLTDFDGDGRLDLVAACHVSDQIVYWKGTGDLAFGKAFRDRQRITFAGKGPRAVAALKPGTIAIAFFKTNETAVIRLASSERRTR